MRKVKQLLEDFKEEHETCLDRYPSKFTQKGDIHKIIVRLKFIGNCNHTAQLPF